LHEPDRSGAICRTNTASGTACSAASAAGSRRCLRRAAGDAGRVGGARTKRRYGRFDDHPGTSLRRRHKKGTQDQEALGRSRGGFTTKIHARCDGQGRPLGFTLTPGQTHDAKGFMTLLRMVGDKIDALLGDKGYDSDDIVAAIEALHIEAVIPSKSNRKEPRQLNRETYKRRNHIERMFNKLKNWRRVATRYDKTASSFLAFVSIASFKIWMPFVHET
jgi:transposase